MTTAPRVDVTIAVHTRTRPIARAVDSVLEHTTAPVRVRVVAHNIDPDEIAANLGARVDDPRVELQALRDGIPSPAGPMNLGLASSTADFVAVMGSDDEFEPGALDSWLAVADRADAAMVIAQIRHATGGHELSPPARPGRVHRLDPVKDRLSYRSAPLGLIDRRRFGHLRFAEGLSSGEDLPFVTSIWFSGHPISFARRGPGYRVNADAGDRVTTTARPVAADFAFLDHILGAAEFAHLTRVQRRAFAIKILRIHLLDAVVNRPDAVWPAGEREALAGIARRVCDWGDRPERALSRLDRRILDGILDASAPLTEVRELIARRWNYRSPEVLLPRDLARSLDRQAPLRTFAGAAFI